MTSGKETTVEEYSAPPKWPLTAAETIAAIKCVKSTVCRSIHSYESISLIFPLCSVP